MYIFTKYTGTGKNHATYILVYVGSIDGNPTTGGQGGKTRWDCNNGSTKYVINKFLEISFSKGSQFKGTV